MKTTFSMRGVALALPAVVWWGLMSCVNDAPGFASDVLPSVDAGWARDSSSAGDASDANYATDAADAADVPGLVSLTDDAHLDMLSISVAPAALVLRIDHANQPALLHPEAVVMVVRPASRTVLPRSPDLSFLGPPGTTIWDLDAGWSVRGVGSGLLLDDSVRIHLESVEGPGRVAIWRFRGGDPSVDFASVNSLPQILDVAYDAHSHRRWSFTSVGDYRIVFRVSATRASDGAVLTSESHMYNVTVPGE